MTPPNSPDEAKIEELMDELWYYGSLHEVPDDQSPKDFAEWKALKLRHTKSKLLDIIRRAEKKALQKLIDDYGGNAIDIKDAAGHAHNIKVVPVSAIEHRIKELQKGGR